MKRLFSLVVAVTVTLLSTAVFAAEMKMIGTITAIKMQGAGAEMILKDRKTEAQIVLQARDNATMEKIKDRKVRVGDELRIRYDGDSKIIKTIQKSAGC
ncbi:MAG: hypothetical protein FIA89_06620 [Geobacter sp.]|jgi:hypothetical protein|nr:hypothetical protein [Geobacter sp.]